MSRFEERACLGRIAAAGTDDSADEQMQHGTDSHSTAASSHRLGCAHRAADSCGAVGREEEEGDEVANGRLGQ